MKINASPAQLRTASLLVFFCLLAASPSLVAQAPGDGAAAAQTGIPGPKAHDNTFVIGPEDVLAIDVWKEADLTNKSIPVRSDGKISLPLVGEVQAAGRTPLQLEQDITDKLKSYINAPQVTVMVVQVNSQKFNILGEISKPGAYPLTSSMTIMDAIALAGGFRDFAKKKGIYILRGNAGGNQAHIPFNYQEFIKGKNPAQNISLQPGDTVIVP